MSIGADDIAELWDAGGSEEVGERGRLVIEAGGRTIGIYRLDASLYAYENTCPHQGGPVCQGLMVPRVLELLDASGASVGNAFDESELHIVCPWHGYEFSIRSGRHAAIGDIRLKPVHVEERGGRIYVGV
jgi:nitrite reductase/ring-hydroxylating ferredoxin subunit